MTAFLYWKSKKRAVVSDCSFFVNMLKYCVRTLKILPKSALPGERSYFRLKNQIARVTLPERRQRVHAYTWQGLPSTRAFTRRTLAFQVLLERLWEWDTLIPKLTPFPQKSHLAIVAPPLFYQKVNVRIISNINEKSKYLSAFFPNNFVFFIVNESLFAFNKNFTED